MTTGWRNPVDTIVEVLLPNDRLQNEDEQQKTACENHGGDLRQNLSKWSLTLSCFETDSWKKPNQYCFRPERLAEDAVNRAFAFINNTVCRHLQANRQSLVTGLEFCIRISETTVRIALPGSKSVREDNQEIDQWLSPNLLGYHGRKTPWRCRREQQYQPDDSVCGWHLAIDIEKFQTSYWDKGYWCNELHINMVQKE